MRPQMDKRLVCLFLCIGMPLLLTCFTNPPDAEESHVIYLDEIKSNELPYRFASVDVKGQANYIAADLDGDGADEFMLWENKPLESRESSYLLIEKFRRNSTIAHKPFKGNITLPMIGDWDQDGTNEVFISIAGSDTSWLYIIDHRGNPVLKHIAAVRPHKAITSWECQVVPEHLIDINNDGHLDLIYRLNTGFAYQPRDVVVFDIYNNRAIRSWATGLYITKTILEDIDGDGKREFIIGSTSPANSKKYVGGNSVINGTDDSAARIDALSLEMVQKKGKRLGGEYADMNFILYDYNNTGRKDIVLSFSSHNEKKELGYVAVWDYQSNSLLNRRQVEKETSGNMVVLPRINGGGEEIIIGWEDGTLEILGPTLEVKVSKQIPGLTHQRFRLYDVDDDGREEIIVSGTYRDRSASLVLDRDLRVVALSEKDLSVQQIVDPGYSEKKLLLGYGFLDVKSVTQLLEIKRQIRLPFTIPWAGLIAGIIIGAGLLMIRDGFGRNSGNDESHRKILAACGLPALIIDRKGLIKQINQRACLLADALPDEAAGSPYISVFNGVAWQKFRDIITRALADRGEPLTEEVTINVGGLQSDMLISVNPLQLGFRSTGRLVLVFDVTEVAQTKRAVAWASMAQKLAHEIKTPLSTVMLSTQHLQMECEENADIHTKLNKYIQRIYTQVARLQKLTDSFLKFSRIEAPRCEALAINELLQEWLKENTFKVGSAVNVELQLADDIPAVSGDLQQLNIVIQNLIENSLKAMDGKGVLTIATRLVQSLHTENSDLPGSGVQIEISDTGKGMSPDELEKLFMPFFSRAPGGTGLGLVITKKIIDDHQGVIKVESEQGIGTRVLVTLPA